MFRRFAIVILLLCLPFRLWAGVGLMMNAGVSSHLATHAESSVSVVAHEDSPCHEEPEGVSASGVPSSIPAADSASASCAGGDCRICSACHMPGMHTLGILLPDPDAPRDWVAHRGLAQYAAESARLFKPPVF